MCLCKVHHLDRLGFRDVHLLSKNLRESIDEERLSGSLSVNILNDFGRESLTDLVRILSKEFLHLLECKNLAIQIRLGY